MSANLFDIPESPSPRLQWIAKHGIQTSFCKDTEMDEPWSAWIGDLFEAIETGGDDPEIGGYATGETEDDAIVKLAKAYGLRLWNEEGAQ